MARVALVSGGTRGIGAAISEALLEAGYHVAATCVGNDAAAEAFRARTGARAYRWEGKAAEAYARALIEADTPRAAFNKLVRDLAGHGVDAGEIRQKHDALLAIVQSASARRPTV